MKAQALEINWKDTLKCPTEDEFDYMVQQSTTLYIIYVGINNNNINVLF